MRNTSLTVLGAVKKKHFVMKFFLGKKSVFNFKECVSENNLLKNCLFQKWILGRKIFFSVIFSRYNKIVRCWRKWVTIVLLYKLCYILGFVVISKNFIHVQSALVAISIVAFKVILEACFYPDVLIFLHWKLVTLDKPNRKGQCFVTIAR